MTQTTYIFKRRPDVRFACRILSRVFFGWLIVRVDIERLADSRWMLAVDWHKPRYPRLYRDVGFVDSLRFAWLHLWRKFK